MGGWGREACPSAVGRRFLHLNSHLWAELVRRRGFRRVFSTSTTSCEIKGRDLGPEEVRHRL